MKEERGIGTYPVGLLWDIQRGRVWRGITGYLIPQAKRREWRSVRNYFNGYLAEWHYCPEGVRHTKCGRGWTRRIALRRLGIHIAESNTKGAI